MLSTPTAELKYGRGIVFFPLERVRQGRRNLGDGATELQDDGSIKIELSFDNGDDAVLTARRQ